MIERFIRRLECDNAGTESAAATRERLAAHFPAAAVRRMTQLGLLIGRVLEPLQPDAEDTLVYASQYGESRALEDYLASFPSPSPTLFQTSIHPSAVQQALIARRRSIAALFPLTGGPLLGLQALQTALQGEGPRALVCGGEERGTWLREKGLASETSYAFALELSSDPAGAIGQVVLEPGTNLPEELGLDELFHHLSRRQPLRRSAGSGLSLRLAWL